MTFTLMRRPGAFLLISLFSLLLPAGQTLAAPPERALSASADRQSHEAPGDIMLTQVRLDEAVRMLAQVGKANIVVTGKVSEHVVSLYLRNSTVDEMIRNLCRAAGVWYRYDTASRTYIIMSGEEYQKDLAIVRDEQTRVFTLKHHNVVSTANAIKALFGNRVQLNQPVEEMPPTSLGTGTRSRTGGSASGASTTGNWNSATGGTTTGATSASNVTQNAQATASALRNTTTAGNTSPALNYDPATDLARLSLDRLQGQLRQGASGEKSVSIAEIQELAARQGPPVYVTYNRLNNLLMVRTGDESTITQIGALIAEMDRPPRQVLLEMKILEVTLDDGFRSVFDIGYTKGTSSGPSITGSSSTAKNSISSGLFAAEDDATFVWQMMSNNLSARFQLLAEQNKLKVLSSPMLVAANNQTARLFIGDERVLTVGASSQTVTGTSTTNTTITVETEKRDVGQTLSILPRINGDRSVSLTIDQDSSTVKVGDTTIPISTADGEVVYFPIDTVNTASLQVTAHAQDGMTVAVGGMIRDTTQYNNQKVPILGDIPILGMLFKRDVRASERSQIVLLITPRVLENPQEADALARTKEHDFNALQGRVPDKKIIPGLIDLLPGLPTSAH